MPRRLGCRNCPCGLHRGCGSDAHPPLFNGALVPYQYVTGTAKKDCPCIKADDARIKEKKRLQKEEEEAVKKEEAAQQKAERSLLVRISAIEKALWGKSYDGKVSLCRPALLLEKTLLGKRKRVESKPSKKN